MINILFIHQSAELYGSDKTLLLLLKKLDKTKYFPIVVLPFEGPLKIELEKENIKIVIAPVLKLYRKMFSPKNMVTFFSDLEKGFLVLDNLNKKQKIDIVYSNTLAVLLGFLYAKKRNLKHLWHVHEIIESPKLFTSFFKKLLSSKSVSKIVYNSIATQQFWNKNKALEHKGKVIWNGLEAPSKIISTVEKKEIKETLFKAKDNEVVIALVGRISRWKGQLLLLNAFSEIIKINNNIHLVFVGSSPPNQEEFTLILNEKIQQFKLSKKITVIPFQQDIYKIWQTIDVAVVPSTEPEPFGLVALEAMLACKPVIAANHGGLSEIVLNEETGFLFEPNNTKELQDALLKLIENPNLRDLMGNAGNQRARNMFSIYNYVNSLQSEFDILTKDS